VVRSMNRIRAFQQASVAYGCTQHAKAARWSLNKDPRPARHSSHVSVYSQVSIVFVKLGKLGKKICVPEFCEQTQVFKIVCKFMPPTTCYRVAAGKR
jgi:hypothetical protein